MIVWDLILLFFQFYKEHYTFLIVWYHFIMFSLKKIVSADSGNVKNNRMFEQLT